MALKNMTRGEFLRAGGRLVAAGALARLTGVNPLIPGTARASGRRVLPAQRRPNILVILTDQERSWGTLPRGLSLPRRFEFLEGD